MREETNAIRAIIFGAGTKEAPGFNARLSKVEDFQYDQKRLFWAATVALVGTVVAWLSNFFGWKKS